MEIQLTDELWEMFGFRKENSSGGSPRYYYKGYIPQGVATKSPGYVGLRGEFSFEAGDKTVFKTLSELIEYMQQLQYDLGFYYGELSIKNQFINLMGLNTD